ncbi:MAG: DNA polymerase III subunit delta' [Burkholderiaceae bacterium]
MTPAIHPWQQDAWSSLQRSRAALPHAILFHGREGIGKVDFATRFAQSLLCQNPGADGQPCDACEACRWFAQYSHPDYRRVRPDALETADDVDGEADEEGAAKGGKASKTPSKDIRIEQIRALAGFVNISTHRQGLRVVLLYPAEAMNAASANALLKTLEEPPPGTVFLLVAHRIDRLLPTILSRCRVVALPIPGEGEALDWLRARGAQDADVLLAQHGGAPLAALAAGAGESGEAFDALVEALAAPGVEAALRAAERLQKAPLPELVSWTQRWLYDLSSAKLSGAIRYYPRQRQAISRLAAQADARRLMRAWQAAGERRAVADHPLSAKLFIEDMLLEYSAIFS